jgi:hypothetical protein
MIIKLIGTIVEIGERKSGVSKKGNQWMSQDYVIEEASPTAQTPTKISFTVFGEDAINFYAFRQGQNVAIDCVLASNPYNGKYYTSLRALTPDIPQQQPQPQQQYQPRPQQTPQYQPQQDVNADSLPF